MNKTINKTIGALAITALFFFPYKGFPKDVQQEETFAVKHMAEETVAFAIPIGFP